MKNQQPELPLPNPNSLTLSCHAEELLTQAPKLRSDGWIIEGVKVVGQAGYVLTCRKPTQHRQSNQASRNPLPAPERA